MTNHPIKTVRSHVGYGRLLAQCSEPLGYIPRQAGIPSPYASSPTDIVYGYLGHPVFFREVSHKVYQMFNVPADETITTDDAASDVFMARRNAAK